MPTVTLTRAPRADAVVFDPQSNTRFAFGVPVWVGDREIEKRLESVAQFGYEFSFLPDQTTSSPFDVFGQTDQTPDGIDPPESDPASDEAHAPA